MKYITYDQLPLMLNAEDVQTVMNISRSGAYQLMHRVDFPTIIIGKTLMGFGAMDANGGSFENKISTHGQPISAAGADPRKTIENLGGDSENPFVIFPEVEELYRARREELRAWAAERKEVERKWREENPELSAKLDLFLSGKTPEIDYSKIEIAPGSATRNATATILGAFAEQIENMVVASADLSNSDKTDGFLKKTHAFTKGDWSGQFFQAGVSEFTMACVMNGMANGRTIQACRN